MRRFPFHATALLGLLLFSGAARAGEGPGTGTPPTPASPVVFTFATVGDSRGEPGAPGNTLQDERWRQNTAVWARMIHEIEGQHPQALVFNGDMIHGYTEDQTVLDREYAFWRGMVAGLMAQGTYVLPVPGNHEVQVPVRQPGGGTRKTALESHEAAWRRNMGDLILDLSLWKRLTGTEATAWRRDHHPTRATDGLATSQEQLSFSFDVGRLHLTVLNTDPVGADGTVPLAWLREDLDQAKRRGAARCFIFGHKMPFAYTPPGSATVKESGLDGQPGVRDAFWDLVEQSGATYFCGHQHVYHASRPREAQGGRAWQVIVGSGGSPFGIKPGQSANPVDRMYAWALVRVQQDGTATVQVQGFDERLGPTRTLETFQIP